MTKPIRVALLTIAGFGAGLLLAGICDQFLGSAVYGFVVCPLAFNLIGRRWAANEAARDERKTPRTDKPFGHDP